MKFIQDSNWERALALCEAVLSGEASDSVLNAAKQVLMELPSHTRRQVTRCAVRRGKPSQTRSGAYHDRPALKCALARL